MSKNGVIRLVGASLLAASILVFVPPTAVAGCGDFPESTTPECIAQNLAAEAARQQAERQRWAQDQIDAENRAKQQAEQQYVANGSRPCSLYPASVTPECVASNLEYEEVKKIETAALVAAKEASASASFNTKDENGSLLVLAKVPTKVDLLSTVVKLLNNKGKVVDTGVIRYQASGEPYFVFDNFKGKGNFTVQMSLPKKQFSTIKIKVS